MIESFKSAIARLLRGNDAPKSRECADDVATRLQALTTEPPPTDEEIAARSALERSIIICTSDSRLCAFLAQRGYGVRACDLEGHEECGLLFYAGHETDVLAHMQIDYRSLLDISETLDAIEGHNQAWPKYPLPLRPQIVRNNQKERGQQH